MLRYFLVAAIFTGLIALPALALRVYGGAGSLPAYMGIALLSVVPSLAAAGAFWIGTRFGRSASEREWHPTSPSIARSMGVGLWLACYLLIRSTDMVAIGVLMLGGGFACGLILGIGRQHAGTAPRRWSVGLAYWTCFLLLVLPIIYRAIGDLFFGGSPAYRVPDAWFYTALDIQSALLLLPGGLASPHFFLGEFPPWASTFLMWVGGALIANRVWIAVRFRSLSPPASFRDATVLLAGIGLGFWVFHVLATFGVPGFFHYSRVVWPLWNANYIAVGMIMAWFWITELRSGVALLQSRAASTKRKA